MGRIAWRVLDVSDDVDGDMTNGVSHRSNIPISSGNRIVFGLNTLI